MKKMGINKLQGMQTDKSSAFIHTGLRPVLTKCDPLGLMRFSVNLNEIIHK